jgi:molybdopterin synthase catalytic subunit
MLELYTNALPVEEILTKWYRTYKEQNYGAYINFVGIVRDENEIDGLSFDIYEPLLTSWFQTWQEKVKARGALLLMAHSKGNVYVHESSFIAAVLSPKRRVALETIDEFVEDFKAKAPIWKYDIIDGERIYADDRSTPLPGSGLLA